MEPEEPTDALFREEQDLANPEREAPTPMPSPSLISISKEEYNGLREDASEYKEKYLRALADMENARKRLMKERDENAQQAVIEVMCDFLAPIDHMEHALKFAAQMSPEVQTWATGFEMILMQFQDVLSANGVTPIVALGKPFDPHLHEAIEMVETDEVEPNIILEVCRPGYCKGKRTIRPSRVKVARAPNKQNTLSEVEESEEESNA